MKLPDRTDLLALLKRRKIVQWMIAYLSGAWLTLQVVDVVGEQFEWPVALERGITAILAAGLLVTLVLSWFHGEKGQQRATRMELLVLSAVLVTSGFFVRAATQRAVADGEAEAGAAEALVADPDAVIIAPFAAAAPDSALDRLGRDLSFTVAATLDGINNLRTVDPQTVLAHTAAAGAGLSLRAAIALAAELGAGRVLHGSLTHAGEQIRVDATLYAVDGTRVLARVTALQEPSQISALTDSIVLSLARQLWRGATPDIPSAASLATSSLPALRSYLDGEHALASGDMRLAVAAFERAYDLDTLYLFANWRSLYPRSYEGSRPDSATLQRIVQRRHELPPVDRLLVDVSVASTVSEQRDLIRTAVQRFPTHWPAWYTYANLLVHSTPYLGTSFDDGRAALERVIQLNPGFAPAWEHLFWIVALQRDTAATAETLDRLELFSAADGRFNEELLTLYRTVSDAVVNGDRLSPARLDASVKHVLEYRGAIPLPNFGIGLLIYGIPHTQMQFNEAVLRASPSEPLAEGMWHGIALASAARGAWDSAGVAIDRSAQMNGTFGAAIQAYGLLTTGAALGFVNTQDAARRRPGRIPVTATREERAQLVWLDGVLAWAQRDTVALGRARRTLADTRSEFLPLLGATLEAFELDLSGARDRATQRLLAAEDSAADRAWQRRYSRIHPYVSTVNRLLCARWLLDSDRPADAARLLPFSEAVLPGVPPLQVVNMTVGSLGLYYRARADEAMGRQRDARIHYGRFIQQFDRPLPALEPLLRDARRRLSGPRDGRRTTGERVSIH